VFDGLNVFCFCVATVLVLCVLEYASFSLFSSFLSVLVTESPRVVVLTYGVVLLNVIY